MGAWGYGPFDNDSALDWVDPISDAVLKSIEKQLVKQRKLEKIKNRIPASHYGRKRMKDGHRPLRKKQPYVLRHYEFHESIAACGLLVEQCNSKTYINLSYQALKNGTFDKAIIVVESILKEDEWINTWKEPEEARSALRSLRNKLKRIKARQESRMSTIVHSITTKSGKKIRIVRNPK